MCDRRTESQLLTRSNSLTDVLRINLQFIPEHHLEKIEKRAKWNEELGQWQGCQRTRNHVTKTVLYV